MHWVIQENMAADAALERLRETLSGLAIPRTEVRVVPFDGGLETDIDVAGPVVVVGSMSLVHHALRAGWTPGAWANAERFAYAASIEAFGALMLNHDARRVRLADALDHDMASVFIRPDDDGKLFAGTIMTRADLADWQAKIAAADETWTVTPDTAVIVSPPKAILAETRFVVVDGEVVAGSVYRRGGHVLYDAEVPLEVESFARRQARTWTPDRVCVLDVAQTPDGMRIVEFNNFNSAGWYACDVARIVAAIEALA